MPITVQKTLYLYSELSESAKEKARDWFRESSYGDMAWAQESIESIEAFCEQFGITLTEWACNPYESPEYKTNAGNAHFRGRKLSEFSRDVMPTGYCLDCDLHKTFYDEFKRTGDAKRAFEEALHAGFIAWRKDMEWQLSDEYIADTIDVNEYTFDENGRREG